MQTTADRLFAMRNSINLPQIKLAAVLGISQSALNRYEHNQAKVPDDVIVAYADYFDVSADYILGRTDKPEGKLYTARPNIAGDNEELRQFIEMCFDPKSSVSVRLKDMLYGMMTSGGKES
jgi:transcriptional regulator with XRE-family HTH domain